MTEKIELTGEKQRIRSWIKLQVVHFAILVYKVFAHAFVLSTAFRWFTDVMVDYKLAGAIVLCYMLLSPKRLLDDYFISHGKMFAFELLSPPAALLALYIIKLL